MLRYRYGTKSPVLPSSAVCQGARLSSRTTQTLQEFFSRSSSVDEDDEDDHDDHDDDDMGARNNVCHAATFQNASTTPVWHHYLQINKTGCGRRDGGGPRKIAKVIYSQWRLSTSTWGREIRVSSLRTRTRIYCDNWSFNWAARPGPIHSSRLIRPGILA